MQAQSTASGPYIVTVKRGACEVQRSPLAGEGHSRPVVVIRDVVSCRATATLDEARRQAVGICTRLGYGLFNSYSSYARTAAGLLAEGGTVGPLPDGTVIEVEPANWADFPGDGFDSERWRIDAYNEAHSRGVSGGASAPVQPDAGSTATRTGPEGPSNPDVIRGER